MNNDKYKYLSDFWSHINKFISCELYDEVDMQQW